jgi:hypothetical protein
MRKDKDLKYSQTTSVLWGSGRLHGYGKFWFSFFLLCLVYYTVTYIATSYPTECESVKEGAY